MIKLLKNHWVAIVATIVSAIMCGCAIFIKVENTDNQILEVRTVQMSKNSYSYLSNFEKYNIIENEELVKFSGIASLNEEDLSIFDNVSLNEFDDYSKYNTQISNCFDIEKMQFDVIINIVDNEENVIDEEQIITDAIITETGGLDAAIEINGETYMLSDYQATLNESVNHCGLFSFLISVIVVTIVSYVVVAETAEQIRSKSNYTFNKQLERNGNGVNRGNYITNQRESLRKGFKSTNYRFGFTTFGSVGCEVVAIYNLMIALNKTEMLSETINNVEKWAIEFSVGWGNFGSSPRDIYRYLNKKGVSYKRYLTFNTFKNMVNSKDTCKIIMSAWNKGGLFSGLHTYFINKNSSNLLETYNFRSAQTTITYSSMEDIYNNTGNFIVGYVL